MKYKNVYQRKLASARCRSFWFHFNMLLSYELISWLPFGPEQASRLRVNRCATIDKSNLHSTTYIYIYVYIYNVSFKNCIFWDSIALWNYVVAKMFNVFVKIPIWLVIPSQTKTFNDSIIRNGQFKNNALEFKPQHDISDFYICGFKWLFKIKLRVSIAYISSLHRSVGYDE